MTATKRVENMSPGLLKVVQRAKRDPEVQLHSLAHHLNEDALKRAFRRLRKDAAVGVDGVTKDQYGEALEGNVEKLHQRLKTKRYRHQPIRRVHIPKEKGQTRPIGISTIEDKIVQGALSELLEMLYEPAFMDCSYGFRPGRSAHNALGALDQALFRGEVSWVLEADIQSFFDNINRKMLMEMLRGRIADKSLLRLIGKCLHVGIFEGAEYSEPDEGTVQGSSLSPLLGNVYLHDVLDLWFKRVVQPRLRGRAILVRYADDFVIGFETEDDARRVMKVIGRRFERYSLTLHPDKTRLLDFRRPPRGQKKGKGPATFDFLGFTVFWQRSREGHWTPGFKTRKARLRRAVMSIADWCRSHRHQPVKQQRAALARRIRGHDNYYGVNGNIHSLNLLRYYVERVWRKWLSRRGAPKPMSWRHFRDLLRSHPLPVARIRVRLWSA